MTCCVFSRLAGCSNWVYSNEKRLKDRINAKYKTVLPLPLVIQLLCKHCADDCCRRCPWEVSLVGTAGFVSNASLLMNMQIVIFYHERDHPSNGSTRWPSEPAQWGRTSIDDPSELAQCGRISDASRRHRLDIGRWHSEPAQSDPIRPDMGR